jgi:uncharacterized protein (TIGR03118 family)
MKFMSRSAFAVCFIFLSWVLVAPANAQDEYRRTNLVSDIAGVALRTDPNLINAWGIAFSPTGPVWIADNNAGVSTVYKGTGEPILFGAFPLVVNVPPPNGGTPPAAPTGVVFNPTPGFAVGSGANSGPSIFIFATEDGTISGWNPGADPKNAILAVDNSAPGGVDHSTLGAVYKGLAIGAMNSQTFIYATNFRDGIVEVYDSTFKLVNSFTDPNLPPGFAPFGIQSIGKNLYVTFAVQNAAKHDDVAGPGNGFVDIFGTDGTLQQRFASQGTLNSPWGLAQAPGNFGKLSKAILVGDFGDGRINAFEAGSGEFLGQLEDTIDQPLAIEGLWALEFGNGGLAGSKNQLLFTAGIGGEKHGLFGSIRPVSREQEDQ